MRPTANAAADALASSQRGRKGGAARGALAILSGTAIGQVASLVALPILARLYDPEDFGLLAIALSVSAIAAPLATLRLDGATVLAESSAQVSALLQASLTSLAVASLALGAVIAAIGLLTPYDLEGWQTLAWSIPLLLFVSGTVVLLSRLAVRERDYSKIGTRNTVQSLSITGAQFGFWPLRGVGSFNGLVSGAVFGGVMGALVLRPYAKRYARVVAWRDCRQMVRTYWRFPVVFAPMATFTLLAQQGPVFVVAHRFTSTEVGQFAMADRVVAVPIALIGLAVGAVYEGEMSHRIRSGAPDVAIVYLKTSAVLAAVGLSGGMVLWLWGQSIITWALGPTWSQAGEVLTVMAVVLLSRMVVNPTRAFLQLLEKAREAFVLEVVRVVLFLIAAGVSAAQNADLISTLWTILLALVIADFLTWLYGLIAIRDVDRTTA